MQSFCLLEKSCFYPPFRSQARTRGAKGRLPVRGGYKERQSHVILLAHNMFSSHGQEESLCSREAAEIACLRVVEHAFVCGDQCGVEVARCCDQYPICGIGMNLT